MEKWSCFVLELAARCQKKSDQRRTQSPNINNKNGMLCCHDTKKKTNGGMAPSGPFSLSNPNRAMFLLISTVLGTGTAHIYDGGCRGFEQEIV